MDKDTAKTLFEALLQYEKPSLYFSALKKETLSDRFPELARLRGIPQPPEHHKEGDVWNHTMLVIDEAAKLRDRSNYPLGLMLSALTHDLGKYCTTETINGHIHAYGHERAGIPIAGSFLERYTADAELVEYVKNMCKLHMRPNMLAAQRSGQKAVNRLFRESADPEDLLLLAKADHLGRIDPPDYTPTEIYLRNGLRAFLRSAERSN